MVIALFWSTRRAEGTRNQARNWPHFCASRVRVPSAMYRTGPTVPYRMYPTTVQAVQTVLCCTLLYCSPRPPSTHLFSPPRRARRISRTPRPPRHQSISSVAPPTSHVYLPPAFFTGPRCHHALPAHRYPPDLPVSLSFRMPIKERSTSFVSRLFTLLSN